EHTRARVQWRRGAARWHGGPAIDEWIVVALGWVVRNHHDAVKGRVHGSRRREAVQRPPRKWLPTRVVQAPRSFVRHAAHIVVRTRARFLAIRHVDRAPEIERGAAGGRPPASRRSVSE